MHFEELEVLVIDGLSVLHSWTLSDSVELDLRRWWQHLALRLMNWC